jgi:hypothetical protein
VSGAVERSARLAVAVLAAAVAIALPARADETPREADKLIRHGIELRKAHDDEGALREFQKAYELEHTPRVLGHLGLAEQALGRWEDAERHVREALQSWNDPWVAKNRATLSDALGIIQSHLGRVEVIGDPAGAEVSVNGRTVGKLPLPDAIPVSAGEVDVELRAPGYHRLQRTLTIVAGQYQRVVLRLAKEAPPPLAAQPSAVPTVAPPESGPPPAPVMPLKKVMAPPVRQGPSAGRAALKWTAAGLAVVGLGVGVAFTIIQAKNVSAFDSYKVCADDNGRAVIAGTTTPAPQCQPALDDYRLDTKLAIAGYVGAGVFALTWLVLQLTDPAATSGAGDEALATPVCAPSGAGLGLACALRF